MASKSRNTLQPANDGEYDYKRKLSKNGNNLAVNLPADAVSDLEARHTDEIGIDIDDEEGKMVVYFPARDGQ